jgi:uncharacterized protein (TIGR03382 family)
MSGVGNAGGAGQASSAGGGAATGNGGVGSFTPPNDSNGANQGSGGCHYHAGTKPGMGAIALAALGLGALVRRRRARRHAT